MRWGLPSSRQALFLAAKRRADKLRDKGEDAVFDDLLKMEPDGGTTNVRNTDSKHWTRWLGVENRCVVPFTRFAEPDPARKPEGGRTPNAWFAASEDEPLRFFAGIWVPQWEGVRKIKEGMVKVDLFAFLTTDPNSIVNPIHDKAMPVILRNSDEVETWLKQCGTSCCRCRIGSNCHEHVRHPAHSVGGKLRPVHHLQTGGGERGKSN